MHPRGSSVGGLPLSAGQERDLVVATERGDAAACRQLVETFLPAIAGVARRFDRGGGLVEHTELLQEGVAALLFATKRYDPATGTPFWAYASYWVRKAMQELVAELTRPAALSDHAVRGLARVRAAQREHVRAHGTEATAEKLAAATGFTREQLASLLAVDRPPRSMEEPLRGEGALSTFGELLADPAAERQYERVLDAMEIQAVRDLADRLDERERTVLRAHYGLGRPRETLARIGAGLGLTAERVRQIENGALEKLRRAAAEPPDPPRRSI